MRNRLARSRNCFQWFKDTKMKANHNAKCRTSTIALTVSNGSKILKWKQITTTKAQTELTKHCFQWFKDTKMKANHNVSGELKDTAKTVSNGSKILKWKQITTKNGWWWTLGYCFQWFKDTKMKANHNRAVSEVFIRLTVSNGSKILKWKQITTVYQKLISLPILFPMVQRY